MGPTNNLAYLLSHLAAVVNKQSDQLLQEQLGIGLSQYKILLVLDQNPQLQQSAIADSLGQTEASISRQMKLLEAKGLVSIRIDPDNRRRHTAVPTKSGAQMTNAANSIISRYLGPDFSSLGEDQLLGLLASMQRLHAIVCRDGQVGACNHPTRT